MLKIYGADLSAPCNKVRFVANYLGIEYEYKKISIKERENRTEEYLKIHPAGKIPSLDDDGFILFESDAMIKYLAEKEQSGVYPKGIKERAIVNQWMDFTTIHIGGAMGKVLYNRVFAPFIKVEIDERSLKDGLTFLDRFLPVINTALGKTKYLAGESLTLADIALLATLDPAEIAGIDLSVYQNIVVLRNQLKKEEFYAKCYKEYGESLGQWMKSSK